MKELFEKINQNHKIRFYKKQKQGFRDFIIGEFNRIGYTDISVDKSKNVIIGNPEKAKTVYSAHYDTPFLFPFLTPFAKIFGHLPAQFISVIAILGAFFVINLIIPYEIPFGGLILGLLLIPLFFIPNPNNANDNTSGILAVYNIAKKLKKESKEQDAAFILFNNEEWGLIGSQVYAKEYKKAHKEKPKFLLINLDCVGVGRDIILTYRNAKLRGLIEASAKSFEDRVVVKKVKYNLPSDDLSFKNSCGLTAASPSVLGPLYIPRIHMPNDNTIDFDIIKSICDKAVIISDTNNITNS